MATAMGSIIKVVAVFEIHIERKAVVHIIPKMIFLGLVPRMETTLRAILLCNPHFSMEAAKKNPPMKRKIFRSPNCLAISWAEFTFIKGNKTRGKRAVAGIGNASVIHQKAMRRVTARVFWASGVIPSGLGRRSISKNRGMPAKSPTLCLCVNFLSKKIPQCILILKKIVRDVDSVFIKSEIRSIQPHSQLNGTQLLT